MNQSIKGAEALIKVLEDNGIEVIFGYPGGANLPIYDALRNSDIKHVLTRHEQGAAHMADGFARVSGKPGVCLVTSGPGATNLITGLANANLDSVPMVAITGQITRNLVGTDAFQEVDCFNISMHVTKHNELVVEEDQLVPALKSAFFIANSGRKGPVLLDIPLDVLANSYPHDFSFEKKLPGYNPTIKGNRGQIKRAHKTLQKAERPLFLIGGGIALSGAIDEFIAFQKITGIPTVRTLMGKGIIEENNNLYLGMIGSHGNSEANKAIHQADVIFAIGTRFGDRATIIAEKFAKKAKLIHLDIDPAEIKKNIPVNIPIVGDIKSVLNELIDLNKEKPVKHLVPWVTSKKRQNLLSRRDGASIMEDIFTELSLINKKLHITTDVGRHQMWATHYCTNMLHLPLITSGGLGTMGFGLPAAIGAWFSDPNHPVVNISGDGSFMMSMQEFSVAVEHNVPITVILLNDYRLGMIRELQDKAYSGRHTAHSFGKEMNFPLLAEAMGGIGLEVTRKRQIATTLRKAINSGKPTLVHFDLHKLTSSSFLKVDSIAS